MTENNKKAVALAYEPAADAAPKVVAKGAGPTAEAIIALAKEHGIPLRQDPSVIEALAKIELDQEIPPELYRVVAEILAFVYRITGKTPIK